MTWRRARSRAEGAAAEADGPILSCRGVDVCYDKVQVLFGVDMDIARGEVVALLGTNGAGKSTVLKAVSGLVTPTAGTIEFNGVDITGRRAHETAAMGIVQVPGGKAVFPTLTVAEHFSAGAWLYSAAPSEVTDARITEVRALFPRIAQRWTQMAGNLSGGEQQQLALGMAFVATPSLLIIDELSLGLAPVVVEQLLDMVRRIHAGGCTVVLVEQSVNIALSIAERAYFMEKGEVRFSGPTAELLDRGDILRSVFLEGAAPNKPAAKPRRKPTRAGGAPVLEVVGLTKRFGGINAVDDLHFSVAPGQILGLIGPNGAGKTTVFDLVCGLLSADAGAVRFDGADITRLGPDRRARLGVGRSFQDARLFSTLTVAECIAIGMERHLKQRDHLASLLALEAVVAEERGVSRNAEELVELLQLGAYRDKFIAELSTGTRRIVDLAMTMAHKPKVLLLDEPSSGIAQRETEALAPVIRSIQHEAGCAVLLIEHDMGLVRTVSDEVLALDLGAAVTRGAPDEVLRDPRVVASYLGGDPSAIHRSGRRRTKPRAKSRSAPTKSATSAARP